MSNNKEANYKEILEVGQIYKSYRALCEHLGEEVKTSNSKNAQLKRWERFFSFKKEGYKLRIIEIHEEVKPKDDNRKGGNNTVSYIDKIELLILDLLSQETEKESVFLSKNKLLKALNMVNDNYTKSKYKPAKLASLIEISRDEIEDFYQSSDSLLHRNIEAALKRLRSKSLIIWESIQTVGYVETYAVTNRDDEVKAIKTTATDRYGDKTLDISGSEVVSYIDHRRATEEEKDLILYAEYCFLSQHGFETGRDAFLAGKFNEMYEKVNDYLFEHHNIYMYYDSYEITFNRDNIITELEKQRIDGKYQSETRDELNKEIIERMSLNAKNRSEKSIQKLPLSKSRKHVMRSSFTYLSNHKTLLDSLIDLKAPPTE